MPAKGWRRPAKYYFEHILNPWFHAGAAEESKGNCNQNFGGKDERREQNYCGWERADATANDL
jgi:hypothetical protein